MRQDCYMQIPRFAFEKFPGAKAELTTQMKSVGEAMAIGRTFQESFQKVNCDSKSLILKVIQIPLHPLQKCSLLHPWGGLVIYNLLGVYVLDRMRGCRSGQLHC